MIKSMTAYGRAEIATPSGLWVAELHCVNRKGLDMAMYLPKELLRFDPEIRKWVSDSLSRGQVTIRITSPLEGSFDSSLRFLQDLKKHWQKLAFELGYAPSSITMEFLTDQMRYLPSTNVPLENEEAIEKAIKSAIELALTELQRMKETEGKALEQDLKKRLKLIEKSLEKISGRAKEAGTRQRTKLEEKIKELALPSSDLEARLLQEVVFLVERADITEELTRLNSHISQFNTHLESSEKSVGRTLDFLIQEMNREINTISSKSSDLEISQEALFVKGEIEKMREQVQNIE